ncbi:hypothetical protein JHJ32_22395 [Parapedobacter sp. ISTM3]|uniref:hypothetical protein n=1 Tax=Parapedobacter sp. ISTM3 TaxID=2800130 RepID=UPI0019062E5D|nr:hypothetical protein [Parapedobacter sp. ISTM3]MBK1442760.1 hypothetical protein [Parapedobacter sp. ISTM3]
MEEIKSNAELVLERLKKQNQAKDDSKIKDFDFKGMFDELDKSLNEYKKDFAEKSSASEIKLSELTLTS